MQRKTCVCEGTDKSLTFSNRKPSAFVLTYNTSWKNQTFYNLKVVLNGFLCKGFQSSGMRFEVPLCLDLNTTLFCIVLFAIAALHNIVHKYNTPPPAEVEKQTEILASFSETSFCLVPLDIVLVIFLHQRHFMSESVHTHKRELLTITFSCSVL